MCVRLACAAHPCPCACSCPAAARPSHSRPQQQEKVRWEEQRRSMQQDAQQKAQLAQYQVSAAAGCGGRGVVAGGRWLPPVLLAPRAQQRTSSKQAGVFS